MSSERPRLWDAQGGESEMHLPAGVTSGASAERVLEQLLAHPALHRCCAQKHISHGFT